MWPEQARHPAFIKYLKSQYDYKQLEAIEMAACHLGGSTSIPFSAKPSSCTISSQQRPSVGQPSTSRLGPSTGKEHKKDQRQQTLAPVPMSSPPPKLSFVLIQGPPGTGKTHTVRGVLNVWHLVAFQRYYESMVQHVLPHVLPLGVQGGAIYSNHATTSAAAPGSNSLPLTQTQQFDMLRKAGNNSNSKNSTSARLGATFAATKPRILICTPSNAACDELMARVMALGFCDGSGTIYRPNIVRAGADDSVVAPAVRERSLRSLVARYRDMSQPEWQRRCADTAAKMALAEQEVAALEASLERCRPGQEASSTARRLVDRVQAAHRLRREVERLEAARDLVWGSGGGGGERGDDTTQAATYRAETELEALLLSEAEMVFATLSSTQRKVFKAVAAKYPFSTVLIDEAGQSSEVAALQPLSFGAKQVVLVGDPQQLPATILSEAAKSVMMERSLFERLQAQGCPVVLLTVQYRMHPEIRSFPSRHFYENKLEDAPSVVELPPEVYHSHTLFKPYAVFDVARGREQRRQGAGGSLSNAAEAELAACLYASLRSEVLKQHNKTCATISNATGFTSSPAKVSVAVITPYREQRAVLRQTFISVCGSADVLKEVAIETVDSYQGRQVDIVILSCVRAGATGGLGFVNDIRRLNVAITRARRSLWVLGSVATLRSNVEWRALLDDAEERGVVVHDAHAEDLFPDLEYWQRKEQITDAGGGDFKKDKGGKKQQQQKQKEKQQSSDIAGPSVVMPDDSRKRPTRGEEEEEAEKELQGGRRKEERASDGDMRPAAGTRPNVGGGVGGGGRGVKGAGRGRVGGGGGPVATAGRGRRSSKKRERSISPQPETIPAPPPAEPSSSKKYPSMPTRR
jgi:senataxin